MRTENNSHVSAYDDLMKLAGNTGHEESDKKAYLLRYGGLIGPIYSRKKVVKSLIQEKGDDVFNQLLEIAEADVELAAELVHTGKDYVTHIDKIIDVCNVNESFGKRLLKHRSFKHFCDQYFLQDVENGAEHWKAMRDNELILMHAGQSSLSELLVEKDKRYYALAKLLAFFKDQNEPLRSAYHGINDSVLADVFNQLILKGSELGGRLSRQVVEYFPQAVIGCLEELSRNDSGNKDLTRLFLARISLEQLTDAFTFDKILKALEDCYPFDNFKRCASHMIYSKLLKTPFFSRPKAWKLSVEQLVRLATIYKEEPIIIKAILKKPLFRKSISERFEIEDWLHLINKEVVGVQNYVLKHKAIKEKIKRGVEKYLVARQKAKSEPEDSVLHKALKEMYLHRETATAPWSFIKEILAVESGDVYAKADLLGDYLDVTDSVLDETALLSVSMLGADHDGDPNDSYLQVGGSTFGAQVYPDRDGMYSDSASESSFHLQPMNHDGARYDDMGNNYMEVGGTGGGADVLIAAGKMNPHSTFARRKADVRSRPDAGESLESDSACSSSKTSVV